MEQNGTRVDWCKKKFENFDGGHSKNIFIITGDEIWIYQYDPKMKRQFSVWILLGENPPTKVNRSKSAGKKMACSFFRISIVLLEDQRTATAD